jgi:hypothetical protein
MERFTRRAFGARRRIRGDPNLELSSTTVVLRSDSAARAKHLSGGSPRAYASRSDARNAASSVNFDVSSAPAECRDRRRSSPRARRTCDGDRESESRLCRRDEGQGTTLHDVERMVPGHAYLAGGPTVAGREDSCDGTAEGREETWAPI